MIAVKTWQGTNSLQKPRPQMTMLQKSVRSPHGHLRLLIIVRESWWLMLTQPVTTRQMNKSNSTSLFPNRQALPIPQVQDNPWGKMIRRRTSRVSLHSLLLQARLSWDARQGQESLIASLRTLLLIDSIPLLSQGGGGDIAYLGTPRSMVRVLASVPCVA